MTLQDIATRLNNIYDGDPWFESIQTKLKSVTEQKAFQQPVNNRHSIAEILSHMEFWRKSLIEQLKGNDTSAYSGSNPANWPSVDTLKEIGWENIKTSFQETQAALLMQLQNTKSASPDLINNLNGLVDHDIYHIGQIGIVNSLLNHSSR